jgi:hypothetical protein
MIARDAIQSRRSEVLTSFIGALASNLQAALSAKDDVSPALVLLAQLTARARRVGVPVPSDVETVFETALQAATPSLRSRIETLSNASPSTDDLKRTLQNLSETKYAGDLGYDATESVIIARQLLSDTERLSFDDVILCIETLCDHTLGGGQLGTPTDIGNSFAAFLDRGITIHACALNDDGQLVRASITSGDHAVVIEDVDTFNRNALARWGVRFPFDYMNMDDSESVMGDDVRRTVDRIGTTATRDGRLLFAVEPVLQRLPMNLLRSGDDFLGDVVPARRYPASNGFLSRGFQPRAISKPGFRTKFRQRVCRYLVLWPTDWRISYGTTGSL